MRPHLAIVPKVAPPAPAVPDKAWAARFQVRVITGRERGNPDVYGRPPKSGPALELYPSRSRWAWVARWLAALVRAYTHG